MDGKVCPKCKQFFTFSNFHKDSARPNKAHTYCKPCNRERTYEWRIKNPARANELLRKSQFKKKYNLTIEEYQEMILLQDGKCYLCGGGAGRTGVSSLSVDHDHKNGKVRKLLCSPCNLGLGAFRDNPEALRKAAKYIEDHR